jgi:7-cyano-7-deazaguanine synthase
LGTTTGLLLSCGLDSAILLAHLADGNRRVQPFYVCSGLVWEAAERAAIDRFLAALEPAGVLPVVVLQLPLGDLYQGHWSVTGHAAPRAGTPDEAVYLPGRNALLLVKVAIWCQLRGIAELALGALGSNPFPDATPSFFAALEATLSQATGQRVRITCPFAAFDKRGVMQLGRDLPLVETFSCIAPVDGRHCGRCNKCGERQTAFAQGGLPDPTDYVTTAKQQPAAAEPHQSSPTSPKTSQRIPR